ncbi:hypothetical protein JTE90_016312 [Oedothorax gibbosus]|uniref:Uncharacterized protein n=1 Tax=Oedothorax gibbosus TaxID=931172 RepID=A0AAV6TQA0_9ARAC|nr:hypothetical protein JTE90_016312 [Oedothorax gibbosus]
MENLQIYESIIRHLAAKPISTLTFHLKSVQVAFSNGSECSMKWDLSLRLFLISLQQVHIQRQEKTTPDCIRSLLGYFSLLGWQIGECVTFEKDNLELAIEFS